LHKMRTIIFSHSNPVALHPRIRNTVPGCW